MEPINLDNTKALERCAAALEKIAHMKEQEPVAILSAGEEPGEFEALPVGGVPILLIIQVLFALIRFVRARRDPMADKVELTRLLDKLEPYLPEAPVMCEHASESARETGIKLLKKMRELKELDEMEGDADE